MRIIEPLSTFTRWLDVSAPTDGVTDIAKSINENGIAAVVIAVLILIVFALLGFTINNYKNIKKNRNKYSDDEHNQINKLVDKAIEDIINQNGNDIKTLTTALYDTLEPLSNAIKDLQEDMLERKEKEKNDYHKDIVGSFIDINSPLRNAAQVALNTIHCDRVGIYVFHNGNTSLHGLPFFKMSCIGDIINSGVSTLRGKYQSDIPLQMFDDFIENLYKDGYYIAENIDLAIDEDPSLIDFTNNSRVKALYILAIKDFNGAIAGFIDVEFNQVQDFSNPTLMENIKNSLNTMSSIVTPIITDYQGTRNNQNS